MTIGVRPEDVDVAASRAGGGDEARVSVVEPMGSETLVTLEYRAQRLVARGRPTASSSQANRRGFACRRIAS